ncbi:MAG: molybdopterin-dependent oxidoreductase [Acetobacteraceae bacterium]|nr:molybdopterin-dependent oxidoreductase [Acetobacteraceae bacterium]
MADLEMIPHGAALARRHFLAGVGGLLVGFAFTPARAAEVAARNVTRDAVDSYLAIAPDGAVTIYSGKVDLGTGLRAVARQMVAEELGLDPAAIALVEGDTALTPDQGPTSGSTGTAIGCMQLRRAAATARGALLRLAAERLKLPADTLELADGSVRGGGQVVSFAGLIGGGRFELAVDPAVALRPSAQFRVIGQSMKRPDLPEKLTGRHVYVQDFVLPGMLHGRTIRPPAVGATLLTVDEASVASIPGVRVVRRGSFLGVVAETEWNAIRAAQALRATWSDTANLPGSAAVYDAVRGTPLEREELIVGRGDAAARFAAPGARVLRATYEWPTQSHASLGPSCAVADVRGDGATIWTASQGTHKYRPLFARFLGLPVPSVRLVYLDGAGCYGMNGHDDAAADAALMSQALGRPVRVQWMRQDEHGWDPKGPPQLLDLTAALDGSGGIGAWQTVAFLPHNTPGLPAVPLLGPEAAGLDQPRGMSSALVQGNADPPYAIPDLRVAVQWLKQTPLRPSNLRAPGKIGNIFAVESFVDELAAAAGTDPIAFRLALLREPRGREMLQRLATRMAWQPRPSPGPIDPAAPVLHGRGIAYVHYKNAENFVMLGVEASVTRATGEIRVSRMVCVHECGLMVNPDGVRNQVEGSLLQTLSRTLFEEVTYDRARVTSTDWSSYPILTFPDVPILDIDLVQRLDDRPLGAGEAAAGPVAAAVGNAVFDATGIRLRRAPFTPERVKAALAGHAA